MAFNQVQNRDIINNIQNDLGLNPGPDALPSTVTPSIQPVYPVYEKVANICVANSNVNSTSQTIYTTPANKDFYVTSLCLSVIKDATATSTDSTITGVVNGATITLARIAGLTLTAMNDSITMSFPVPIKLDRGTAVNLTNSTNVANVTSRATVQGFTKNNRTNEAA